MDKLPVYLSWSGDRSRALAELLNWWVPRVVQAIEPWVSSYDIEKGSRWSDEVGARLEEHSDGIVCVTPENQGAPWLLFEAGAISKSVGEGRVRPLLLGMTNSDLAGPLSQFQSTVVERADMLEMMRSLNSRLGDLALDNGALEHSFVANWDEFEAEANRIGDIEIADSPQSMLRVLETFANYGIPEPTIGAQAVFQSGFESHGLYSTVTEVAAERLYIFGRKNRKLFDKEHSDFFETLAARVAQGFDFRVLFLDPDAPDSVIRAAHQDDDFRDQLRGCLEQGLQRLRSNGLDPATHVRLYDVHRTMNCVIVDEAVVFSPVSLAGDGRAKPLTKAPFTVLNTGSAFGGEILDSFEAQWAAPRDE